MQRAKRAGLFSGASIQTDIQMDIIFDDPQSIQPGQSCTGESMELIEVTKVQPDVNQGPIAQAMEDHTCESMPTFQTRMYITQK